MLTVQKDVYSAFLEYLSRAIVAAYDQRKAQHAALDSAVALLRGWNGQVDKDEAAPMAATLAYQHLRRMAAEKASPALGARYEYQMAPAVIEKLLRTRPAGWFNDWDEAILQSFAEGLEEGRRTQGRDAGHWSYGKYAQLLLANPVGRHLPLVAGLFDIGPVAMSGGATTVKQLSRDLGPSMRLDADLSDWDRSLLECTTGQSGQVLSRHYKDQWEHYYSAQSFPMQFRKVTAKDVLTLVP
jgi:penicillin amidase